MFKKGRRTRKHREMENDGNGKGAAEAPAAEGVRGAVKLKWISTAARATVGADVQAC
jgi:hypothetical protein